MAKQRHSRVPHDFNPDIARREIARLEDLILHHYNAPINSPEGRKRADEHTKEYRSQKSKLERALRDYNERVGLVQINTNSPYYWIFSIQLQSRHFGRDRERISDDLKQIYNWISELREAQNKDIPSNIRDAARQVLSEIIQKAGKLRASLKGDSGEPTKPAPANAVEVSESPLPSANVLSTRLSWKPLGAKLASFSAVRDYVERSQTVPREHSYDLARLELLYNLQPDRVYVGQEEFEGYIVFLFRSIAILECPVIGNALYALRGQWQILARKSKAELLEDKSGSVERIEHRGDWPARVRALIERPVE
ncbi:MAG TPA: hypothetical protein VFS21_02650 [Roseiflexaceae bacterium]|nr:hypothetical protein [Roseiflexaceae bacterium]